MFLYAPAFSTSIPSLKGINPGFKYHPMVSPRFPSTVNANPDSTEVTIQRTIEGIQKMIKPDGGNYNEDDTTSKAVIEISLAMKRHWESEIKILRDAPRDEKKLSEIIKVKQEE